MNDAIIKRIATLLLAVVLGFSCSAFEQKSGVNLWTTWKWLFAQPVGTMMYMPGHIVLYLGDYQGKTYIFHQAFATLPPDGHEPVQVATALVSDLSINRASGQTFAQSITDLIVLQSPEK